MATIHDAVNKALDKWMGPTSGNNKEAQREAQPQQSSTASPGPTQASSGGYGGKGDADRKANIERQMEGK